MTTFGADSHPQATTLFSAYLFAALIDIAGYPATAALLEKILHGVSATSLVKLVALAAVLPTLLWVGMKCLEPGTTARARLATIRLALSIGGWRLPVRPREANPVVSAAVWIGIVVAATAVHVADSYLLDAVMPAHTPGAAELQRQADIDDVPLVFLPLSVLMLAALEESFFRGPVVALFDYAQRIQPRRRRRLRLIGAGFAIISTVAFALAHVPYSPANAASAAIGGVIYLTLALVSKSILPSIAVHTL